MSENIKIKYGHKQVQIEHCDLTFTKATDLVNLFHYKNRLNSLVLEECRILDSTADVLGDLFDNDFSGLSHLLIIGAFSFGVCALPLTNHPNPIKLDTLEFKNMTFHEVLALRYLKQCMNTLRPCTLKLTNFTVRTAPLDESTMLFTDFVPTTIHMTSIPALELAEILRNLSHAAFNPTQTYTFHFFQVPFTVGSVHMLRTIFARRDLQRISLHFNWIQISPTDIFNILKYAQESEKQIDISFVNDLNFTGELGGLPHIDVMPHFPEIVFHTNKKQSLAYNTCLQYMATLMVNNKKAKTLEMPQLITAIPCSPLTGVYPNLEYLKIITNCYGNIFDAEFEVPRLQKLYVTDANLTKLPVLPELRELRCFFDEENHTNFENIKHAEQLTCVWVGGRHFTGINYETLAHNLPCENLTTMMHTANSTVDFDHCMVLCKRLLSCRYLEKLYLHYSPFDTDDANNQFIQTVCQILTNNPFLRVISFMHETYTNKRIIDALNSLQYFVDDNSNCLDTSTQDASEIVSRNKYNIHVRGMSMLDYCLQSLRYAPDLGSRRRC